jgi:hypothetical protein
MSHITTTIWTCDRCKTATEDYRQPEGWARVIMTTPVLANPLEVDDEYRTEVEVCDPCSAIIRLEMFGANDE